MFCPACGRNLERNAQFCPDCGMKIIPIQRTNEFTDNVKAGWPESSPGYSPSSTQYSISSSYKGSASASKSSGFKGGPKPPRPPHFPKHPKHQKPPKHGQYTHPNQSSESFKVVAVLIVAVIIFSSIIGVFVVNFSFQSLNSVKNYTYHSINPAPIESLSVESQVHDVEFNYNETAMDSVIEIDLRFDVWSFAPKHYQSLESLYTINWVNSSGIKRFEITPVIMPPMVFDNTEIVVTLRTDIVYNLSLDLGSGNADITIPVNTNIYSIDSVVETGNLDFKIEGGVVFQDTVKLGVSSGSISLDSSNVTYDSNIELIASSGTINADFSSSKFKGNIYGRVVSGNINMDNLNPKYENDIDWIINATSGNIRLDILQTIPISSNVSVDIRCESGNIDIEYEGLGSAAGVHFDSSVLSGNIDYDHDSSFLHLGDALESTGYSSSSNRYDFDLRATSGNIDVDASN